MKLSTKGLMKLLDWGFKCKRENDFFNSEKPQFEASDFMDAVVLTLEEAHAIRLAINVSPGDEKVREMLEKRIEQAEKEND